MDTKHEPTPFGRIRAEQLWQQRRWEADMSHALTPGEDAYVTLIWKMMPDDTSWMSAFFAIMNDRLAFRVIITKDGTGFPAGVWQRHTSLAIAKQVCAELIASGIDSVVDLDPNWIH